MRTSYWVKCPHAGCTWSGSLLPAGNADAWRGASPTRSIVTFQCPECRQEWHARVIGDDVVVLRDELLAQPAHV